MPNPNTIRGEFWNTPRKEAIAIGIVKPGHLAEYDANGKVKANSEASVARLPLIVLENETNGDGVEVNYAVADNVLMASLRPGDEAYMKLKNGENVAAHALLESAGDGTLQAVTSGGEAMFEAREAVNASGGEDFILVVKL